LKFNRIIYLFLFMLLLLAASVITAALYSIDDNALVSSTSELVTEEMEQIKGILRANNPSTILATGNKKLQLSNEQSNQLLRYVNQVYLPALRARSIFDKDRVYLKASYELPQNPLGRFFNMAVLIKIEYGKYLVIEKINFGRLSVPRFLINMASPYVLDVIKKHYASYVALWDHVKRIDVSRSDITLHYQLDRADLTSLKKMASEALLDDELRARINAYHAEMEQILERLLSREQSIINVISPLFSFAEKRSRLNHQPVEENRIALLTLGAYMVGKAPAKYTSDKPVKVLKKIKFTLKERADLAKHFLVSAAINAVSDAAWSNAIGLQKELKDSDGGSGFSFVDLMADIAGNKLAALAFDASSAAMLQQRLKNINSEQAIMGDISYLPEGLTAAEFKMEYGSTRSEEYTEMVREIERRLLLCSAYQR